MLVAGAVAGVFAGVSPAAAAEGAFTPCAVPADGDCATLAVPLDPGGALPGTVTLDVSRIRTGGSARGAIIPLAGGPGQAVSGIREDLGGVLRKAAAGRDIVFFDQRGTGNTGVLRCRVTTQNIADSDTAIRACAEEIGPARSMYTTAQSVLDIESVRVLAGVDRITLYGISYGTRVALEYARHFPDRVEALILDSVVPLDGSDPFRRSSFAAVGPALRAICARGACRGIATNPAADLTRLLARMGERPLGGAFVDSRGRVRRAGVTRDELFQFLLAGDLDPVLRAVLPGALRSAVEGDSAALVRAVVHARGQASPVMSDEANLSTALFVTTTCEEEPVPWDRAAPLADRVAQAQAALALVPDAQFAPFGRAVAAGSPVMDLCRNWPAPAAPAIAPGPAPPLPDVPVLALAGKEDLRTPTTDAFGVAALFPRGAYLEVPGVAHSVLTGDASGCARRAIQRFLAGAPVARCAAGRRPVTPFPRPPRAVRALTPSRGVAGRPGRTLRALSLTLDDAVRSVRIAALQAPSDVRILRVGGLRGGRLVATQTGLVLDRVVYVPGVVVSGTVRKEVTTLTASGRDAAGGTITVSGGRVTGVLGGVTIDRPVQVVRG